MRYAVLLLALCTSIAGFSSASHASVVAQVDISQQTMRVYVNGGLMHVWPVSTGRSGYATPAGVYRPYVLRRFHRSRKYNNSPMPYSIFFRGGYAIHGSYETRALGRQASHGCIRLHPANAAELFQMVGYYGKGATRIIIHR